MWTGVCTLPLSLPGLAVPWGCSQLTKRLSPGPPWTPPRAQFSAVINTALNIFVLQRMCGFWIMPPDSGFHNQSSHPQMAFQEDTNTVETLINHSGGRGALRQQGHSCLRGDSMWERGLEGWGPFLGYPGHCLCPRERLGMSASPLSVSLSVKRAYVCVGCQCCVSRVSSWEADPQHPEGQRSAPSTFV